MSENRFAKYAAPQQGGSGNRFAKYGQPDQARDKIIASYAEDIIRRNSIYGGIPQAQLQDPERLYRLAQMEAERAGYKPPEVEKQNQLGSFAIGYGQGGSFGFADEISGAADFVGAATPGIMYGDIQGGIERGKEAYSKRVESDRAQLRMARYDNPMTTIAGELTGGVVTTAPMPASWVGAGARTTGQVALQTADKAAKLQKLSQAATGARQARLAAKSAALSAKSAKLAMPAKTVGEAAGRFGMRVGESVGKGIGYGSAYGGVYGFGAAEGSAGERLDETVKGAAIGGVAGGVFSPAVQFIAAPIVGRIGYGMLTSADNKALDIIIKRAERSGTSLQKVQTDFDAWAKTGEVPETLAELMGPNERSLLSALITVNRETREQATNVFVGRGRGEVNRLEDAFAKSFGASRKDYQSTKAAAAQARAKEAEPFYEGAYIDASTGQRKFLGQQETDAFVYEIGGSRVAQSTLSTASDYADALGKRAIRDEIDDFAEAMRAGRPVKPLSVEAADYIERGINRRYGAATRGEAQDIPAGLRGLRDRVRTIIDPSGLGNARATAAEAIRRGELLDEGLGIMSPTVDVDDVNRIIQGVPEAGIAPASDLGRQAYGVGASRAIANELRNVPDMGGFADATRKVARTPALRDKLEAARPKVLTKSGAENKGSKQTKANAALDQAIERASDRAQFGVDMVGNSRTAFRQGDVEDAVLDDAISTQVGQSLSDLLITGVGGAGNQIRDKLARTIGNRLGQPSIYRPNINRAAADVLLATGNDIPKQIARLAARAASRRVSRITMRGLPPPPGSTPPPGRPRPPSGGSPTPSTPIAAGGFAGLRTDLGNAAVGAGVGALGPAESNEERLRNMAIGAGVMGVGGRVSRNLGARNALAAQTRTAGVGGNGSGNAGRFRFGPTGKAFNPWSTKVQDEIIRTSGGTIDARNIDDLMSVYTDDLLGSTPQEIVSDLRRQAAFDMQHGGVPLTQRDVEYLAFAELMARHLKPMRGGTDDILTAGFGGGRGLRSAAIRIDGKTYTGKTHAQAIGAAEEKLGRPVFREDVQQGYVDASGKFLARDSQEAALAALSANQIDDPIMRMSIEADIKAGRNVALVSEAVNFDKAASPILTAGIPGGRGPQKPTEKSKLGTRAADATAIGILATGGPTAQADTGNPQQRLEELSQREAAAQQLITEYDQALKTFEAMAPKEKQVFLKNNGYTGKNGETINPDGDVRGITGFAIDTYKNELKAAKAEQQAERELTLKQINQVRVGMAERQENPPNPLIDKVAELGTYAAMIYGAHRLRGAAIKGSQTAARGVADDANALLTRLPVPPKPPNKTLLSRVPVVGRKENARIKKATTAANKSAQAVEERLAGRDIPPISSNPTSENGLPIRQANLAEFDRRQAAGDFGPAGPIGRFLEPVNSRFRAGDLGLIGAGAADAHIMQGMLDKTRADIAAEEVRLDNARKADNGAGNPELIAASNKRLEQLRKAESVQTIMQRIGLGLMMGGTAALAHGRYSRPQPRFEAANRERELIRLAQTPPPSGLMPVTPQPPALLSPPSSKSRTVGKPRKKPPVSFSSGQPRKPTNDNNR